VWFGVAKLWII